jgi:hypothetical protein
MLRRCLRSGDGRRRPLEVGGCGGGIGQYIVTAIVPVLNVLNERQNLDQDCGEKDEAGRDVIRVRVRKQEKRQRHYDCNDRNQPEGRVVPVVRHR